MSLLRQSASQLLVLAVLGAALAHAATAHADVLFAKTGPFDSNTVNNLAEQLSKEPYKAPEEVPDSLAKLDYDEYRAIRFRPDQDIWNNSKLPYRMDFLIAGYYYKEPIEVATVADGEATHITYRPSMFSVEAPAQVSLPEKDVGFSGLRLRTTLNKPDVWDELLVFQGASYFRALGRNQVYGLSARGLAINTGKPSGEEFPMFRAFWVEQPSQNSNLIKVYALLDSPSVTGAYLFTVRPGTDTVMDVQATLYPRTELTDVGLAPETSMFYFAANDRKDIDDFRPAVHDSDGLLMINGRGERLWRPLSNPATLQFSAFEDQSPWGFGLMQRNRHFYNYEDLEAHYERRPSLWVEPQGDWGQGSVVLVEIPTQSETHDNIVAFWRPKDPLPAGKPYHFGYRLTWGNGPQPLPGELRVVSTRIGRADIARATPRRLVVIDYAVPGDGTDLPDQLPKVDVTASAGEVSNVVIRKNRMDPGYRVSFDLDPKSKTSIDLRVDLHTADKRAAESWIYRWTPTS